MVSKASTLILALIFLAIGCATAPSRSISSSEKTKAQQMSQAFDQRNEFLSFKK